MSRPPFFALRRTGKNKEKLMSIIGKLALSAAALIVISSSAACGDKPPNAADFPNWKDILKGTLFQGPNEHNPRYVATMPDRLGAPVPKIPRADLFVCREGVTAGVPAQDENAQLVVKSIADGRTIVPNARLQDVRLWGIRAPEPGAEAARAAAGLGSMLEEYELYQARIIQESDEGPITAEVFAKDGSSVNQLMVIHGYAVPDAAGQRNECLMTAYNFARRHGIRIR